MTVNSPISLSIYIFFPTFGHFFTDNREELDVPDDPDDPDDECQDQVNFRTR